MRERFVSPPSVDSRHRERRRERRDRAADPGGCRGAGGSVTQRGVTRRSSARRRNRSAASVRVGAGGWDSPDAVVKSMGVMVAGDTTVGGGLDPVARALGASGRDGGGGGSGSNGAAGRKPWERSCCSCVAPTARTCAIASHFGVARRHARLATPDSASASLASRPGACRRWATAWRPDADGRRSGSTRRVVSHRASSHRRGLRVSGAGAPHLVFRCLPAVLERATAATTLPVAESSVVQGSREARGGGGVVVVGSGICPPLCSRMQFPGLGPGGFRRVSRGIRVARGHLRRGQRR